MANRKNGYVLMNRAPRATNLTMSMTYPQTQRFQAAEGVNSNANGEPKSAG